MARGYQIRFVSGMWELVTPKGNRQWFKTRRMARIYREWHRRLSGISVVIRQASASRTISSEISSQPKTNRHDLRA